MNKKELTLSVLEEMGYSPEVDDDGDIFFRYQMKSMFVMMGNEEEDYVVVMMPQFADVESDEETLNLIVCNKITREMKIAKVYLEKNLQAVTATCEFFYKNAEDFKNSMEHSLEILGVIRTAYNHVKSEMKE